MKWLPAKMKFFMQGDLKSAYLFVGRDVGISCIVLFCRAKIVIFDKKQKK